MAKKGSKKGGKKPAAPRDLMKENHEKMEKGYGKGKAC